jgi:hypothetical protein
MQVWQGSAGLESGEAGTSRRGLVRRGVVRLGMAGTSTRGMGAFGWVR